MMRRKKRRQELDDKADAHTRAWRGDDVDRDITFGLKLAKIALYRPAATAERAREIRHCDGQRPGLAPRPVGQFGKLSRAAPRSVGEIGIIVEACRKFGNIRIGGAQRGFAGAFRQRVPVRGLQRTSAAVAIDSGRGEGGK